MTITPPHFRVLADVHIAPAVVEQLRNRSVSIETVTDLLGQDAQDPDILEYAFQNGYTILTHDKKIQTHINDRIAEGKNHCGVFIALDNLQGDRGVGRIVAEVTFWHDAIQSGAASLQEEVYNQVIWIS